MSIPQDPLIQADRQRQDATLRRRIIFALVAIAALGLAALTVRRDPRPVLSQTSYDQEVEILVTESPQDEPSPPQGKTSKPATP